MGSYPYADITVPDNRQRDEYVLMAKICKETERYEEMLKIIEKIVRLYTPGDVLTAEERGLFTAAYAGVYAMLSTGWRKVSEVERREETRRDENHVAQVRAYKSKMEAEMIEVCRGALDLVTKNLLVCDVAPNEKAVYMKMKGDYNRLLAELFTDVTLDAYTSAEVIAHEKLDATNPVWLSTAVDLSTFYHDVKHLPREACAVALRAIDDANVQLPNLRGQSYWESDEYVETLKEYLDLWAAELQVQWLEPPSWFV